MRISLILLAAPLALAGVPEFRAVPAVSGLKMGYQLVVADLNRDGRKDLIVIDERSTELAWYENPTWARHVLAENVPRTINLDCKDLNGDGVPEIAMAHHFETNPEKSVGAVLLLKSGADPRQKWTAKELDRIPTAHRVRWIRIDQGGPVLLVAPLVGLKSRAPDYQDKAPVFAYRAPDWKRETVANDLSGVLHSIAPVDWGKAGKPQHLLTASFDGLDRFEPTGKGLWKRHRIAKGDPQACPQCGSSEVKLGKLGKRRMLAAIEPWHGDKVVVYVEQGKSWARTVLDAGMINGHALAVADLDGDGNDEIVAGFRGKGFRTTVFSFNGGTWDRKAIDTGGVAAADCKIEDLNGDGALDIACSGASTGNVTVFENSRSHVSPAAPRR